jgi:hypothetical protein
MQGKHRRRTTIAEDLSMLAPEGVETLLIGAGSLVTPCT